MNKSELISKISEKSGLSKANSEKALEAFLDVATSELKSGGKVQLIGFGTFEVSERTARDGRNPKTGEIINVPSCKVPKFKVGKALKDAVNA